MEGTTMRKPRTDANRLAELRRKYAGLLNNPENVDIADLFCMVGQRDMEAMKRDAKLATQRAVIRRFIDLLECNYHPQDVGWYKLIEQAVGEAHEELAGEPGAFVAVLRETLKQAEYELRRIADYDGLPMAQKADADQSAFHTAEAIAAALGESG